MTQTTSLYEITCTSGGKNTLRCYADMVVYSKAHKLIAIRYGGYPEAVQGMADVITTGCNLELSVSSKEIIGLDSKEQKGYFKQISHDGVYAECLMYHQDDGLQSLTLKDEDDETKTTVRPNRKIFIFCKNDDELFRELDNRLSVPLMPEFKDYFISTLKTKTKIFERLTVRSSTEPFDAWQLEVSDEETEIVDILTTGLRNGVIEIPGAPKGKPHAVANIKTFTEYLKVFSTEIAGRIKDAFQPKFDPAKDPICDALMEVNQHVMNHAKYSLFDAQLGAAEAIRRQLLKDKLAMLVAECGTGKTKIGAAALYANQKNRGKCFNVVVCPSHLAKKWARELNETVPNCTIGVAASMYDIDLLYKHFLEGDKTVYAVISKETARNGYMRYPAVVWNPIKKGYVCPDCGAVQEMTIVEDSTASRVNADQFFFRRETAENHKCQNPECNHVLWSCLNPDVMERDSEWVRIGGYGYVSRREPLKHLSGCKSEKVKKQLIEINKYRDGIFPAAGAYRRVPLASYIKDHIKHVDGLICDELHQYSGESAQGEAMAELAGIADKVIGLTATLINGYSKGLFYLLFRMKPYLMRLDGQEFKNPRDFCAQYGVVQSVYQMDATYNVTSKSHGRKVRERFLPGVSPLVYARFLLENCVFLSLDDMGKELPDYEECPISCEMEEAVRAEYNFLEKEFKKIMNQDRKYGKKLLSAFLNLLTAYPDQPYGHEPILHPKTKEPLIEPRSLSSFNVLKPKDLKVIELVEEKVKSGERVIIYTAWTRLDSRDKLHRFLTEKGYRVKILDTNIPTTKREEWVDKQVQKGIDVLIVNPALVETGLDLNAFTTLIFYNIAFNLFIFRQAARRSYRINQTAPKISVYMFYYADTLQQRALRLMASKLAAATVIEGSISEEGLAAMSDCQDMMAELAKELMSGIKNAGDIEDLRDCFKKMAINNGHEEAATAQRKENDAQPYSPVFPIPVSVSSQSVDTSPYNQDSAMSFDAAAEHKKKTRKALETNVKNGQLNLFDLLDAS